MNDVPNAPALSGLLDALELAARDVAESDSKAAFAAAGLRRVNARRDLLRAIAWHVRPDTWATLCRPADVALVGSELPPGYVEHAGRVFAPASASLPLYWLDREGRPMRDREALYRVPREWLHFVPWSLLASVRHWLGTGEWLRGAWVDPRATITRPDRTDWRDTVANAAASAQPNGGQVPENTVLYTVQSAPLPAAPASGGRFGATIATHALSGPLVQPEPPVPAWLAQRAQDLAAQARARHSGLFPEAIPPDPAAGGPQILSAPSHAQAGKLGGLGTAGPAHEGPRS